MKKWTKIVSLAWLVIAAPVFAFDTGSAEVVAVDMSSDSVVTVTLNVELESSCNGVLTMDYAAGTLSEIYYTMLMTAKSTGSHVDLGYTPQGTVPLTSCEINRVELSQAN